MEGGLSCWRVFVDRITSAFGPSFIIYFVLLVCSVNLLEGLRGEWGIVYRPVSRERDVYVASVAR